MKKIFVSIFVLSFFAFTFPYSTMTDSTETTVDSELNLAKKINWIGMGDIEAAVKKNPKKTIVDVYTLWCGPCKMMDRNTFSDSDIIKIMSEKFHTVKYNAETPDLIKFQGKEWTNPRYDSKRKRGRNAPHQLTSFFKVRGYPTLVILDENLKIIDKIVGYKKPQQLKAALKKHMNSPSAAVPKSVSTTQADAEEIAWVDMNNIEASVKKNPKKTIVDVYTPWCGPCKMMDKNTFSDSKIIKIMSEEFHAVKFNAENPTPINFKGKKWSNPKFDSKKKRGRNAKHELASFFKVRGYPCLVVLDENMKIVDKILGYKTPEQLVAALKKHR